MAYTCVPLMPINTCFLILLWLMVLAELCSWRDDSTFCFPGTCGNSCEATECTCAPNFGNTSNNCMDSKCVINFFI